MPLVPTQSEQEHRDQVVGKILADVREGRAIMLPEYDPTTSRPSDQFALLSVGIEENPYGGTVGPYRYQFEGEEDLLHLIVVRLDQTPFPNENAQQVVSFLYPGLPPALMWLKPGNLSHHFYVGHDVLLEYLD